MSGYTQLSREQRYQIYALLKTAHKQTPIASVLGVTWSNRLIPPS